ncbi:MarR family winged helix-turn-helix transcriptional regulator [Novosphingobium sp.]|uniref:MarR family winged helix-turn-helix transcriptional regulator n=1 Tax=Novosphingobium sp. TaxID=1874826 RepID=UPI00352BC4BB
MTDVSQTAAGPFEGYLCFSVYAAGLAFNRLYKQVLDRFGLTYPQYLVLVALRQRDGRTVSELGEALFLESNTLTPLIKRLEAAGLVERRRDTRDERVVRVSLSDAGRALAIDIECVPPQIGEAIGIDHARLGQMAQTLDELAAGLRRAVRD